MFKNALVFRIVQWDRPDLAHIEEQLATSRFIECGTTQKESAGWVEPRGEKHAALAENVGGQFILKLCMETKAVPGSVVKSRVEEQADKIERETGRRPKGKRLKELKEDVVQELLPRAFPKRWSTMVWIDPKAGLLVVDTASMKKADGVVSRLMELLGGGITVAPIQTETSPAIAMSDWLKSKEAPAGFSVDRDCELKQPDSDKATVRYARHALEIDEVAEHINQGKVPTQLAMTYDSRLSFVLTESLTLKKIKLLDVVFEGASAQGGKDDGGFDADVAIATGELSRLVPELIEALGGELSRDKPLGNSEPSGQDAHYQAEPLAA